MNRTSPAADSRIAPDGSLLVARPELAPSITIFTIPKPFVGHIGLIQTNAIHSWRQLGIEVLIGGDEAGAAETARTLGAVELGPLERSEFGTPRLDHLFDLAHERASGEILVYVNCDILLFDDFVQAIERLSEISGAFLAIGRRWDLDLDRPLDLSEVDSRSHFLNQARRSGRLAPTVCKDFFAFPRSFFRELPPFLVGRGNWDNWMVSEAKRQRLPVVDLTRIVTAVHQNHDYRHLGTGRLGAYVTGPEAKHNERVGGGRHLISGASADWELTPRGELRRRRGNDLSRFLADLPRFSGLLASFLTRR